MFSSRSWFANLSEATKSMVLSQAQDPKVTLCSTTPLCRRCISVFQSSTISESVRYGVFGAPETGGYSVLYYNPRDFWQAGEHGCFICLLLRSCHPSFIWDNFLRNSNIKTIFFSEFVNTLESIEVNKGAMELIFYAGSMWHPSKARFRLVEDVSEQELPGIGTRVSKSSGSESLLDLAKHWYYDCLLGHESCGPFATAFRGNKWLPTRLIHITETHARLCYGKNLPETGIPYATLSHCWGKNPIFTMKSTNIAELEIELPLDRLPKTFQDAIYFCRHLQIRYLWIDSLCIMQDSTEDWKSEAKVMGVVYKHCCLNIAATGFSDGIKGFFVDRDVQILNQLTVQSEGNPFIPKGRFHLIWDNVWHEQIVSAPLNTRTWVFQERLLSPRIPHFGSREMLWECKEREACESYPRRMPNTAKPLDNQISQQRNFKRDNPIDESRGCAEEDEDYEVRIWDYWCAIVETYSRTKSTKEEDKLIALSGVISEMQILMASECLAGLWRRHLPMQLLWGVSRSEYCNVSRPRRAQASSWSWASLNAGVVLWAASPDPKRSGFRLTTELVSVAAIDDIGSDERGH